MAQVFTSSIEPERNPPRLRRGRAGVVFARSWASNPMRVGVSVGTSYDVTLQNFTINGGSEGVCGGSSVCSLNLNTIQQSVGPAG